MGIVWSSMLAGMLIASVPLGLALYFQSRRDGCPVA
jgi:uncharacterized protein (DUF2062 family)